ncbi:MOXD1 homolog 2 isoform X1 [Osmia bicornis bicornis]|uniref:MOXD1 homolog 2 isoform X1 n=1 Tax=Osmia bicornis bicornis TaxID=1437191 RepID=UPI0010F5E7B2|nr:MOXD1 homolog 2 isoform X1 [Osmia bicornis bicornis]XP_029038862.1 MOXD1 homolog 2 isoform X1 [Osmia bicornis bicornis]XP_029038864.1 MOXD1 homolog 2 isoform X1 [Osmia bicornis bicornis]
MKTVIASCFLLLVSGVFCVEWKHSAVLDDNFLVLWTPGERDIIFEVQVKTLGYVGLGFTKDDGKFGADMVIGWVDNNGQLHLQDRHVKETSKNPQMDLSQDYCLLLGFENKTHTVLRFSRRYDTCDSRDLKITNDTVQVVWQYHMEEPVSAAGVLPDEGTVHRGSRPLYLVQRDAEPRPSSRNQEAEPPLQTWDILNQQVRLPEKQDTLLWCRVLQMPNIDQKHHVVKYEPVIQPGSQKYLHHMTLYECRGDQAQLESASKSSGSVCYQSNQPSLQCTTIAAIWSLGSEGFNYPPEAGYALDPRSGPHFYMLETLYTNSQMDTFISDSSGLRLHYTDRLRTHDAGILSVGIDPNWRHIIPPGQPEVVSEGHCISDCTGQTIPNNGINIFAVIMHTHQLGRKVRLRQIRSGEELPPIASDTNYNPSYQEYRKLQKPVRVYPGDHLVAECTYSSESREAITLGGLTTREETCLVSTLYYPRIELSVCYSLPSLPTVLQSLGVQKLIQGSSPVEIQEPAELSGMTLEERLVSYDWKTSFKSFQDATRTGTFKPLCWTSEGALQGTDILEVRYPRILRPYKEVTLPCLKKPSRNKLSMLDIGTPADPDSDETNAVERGQLVRSKVSRSSDGPTGGSSSTRSPAVVLILGILLAIVGGAFR